jgi:hypothetical protein
LSEGLINNLFKYLAFRHFFVHSYGFMLEEIQLDELAKNIYEVGKGHEGTKKPGEAWSLAESRWSMI